MRSDTKTKCECGFKSKAMCRADARIDYKSALCKYVPKKKKIKKPQ